MKATVNTLMLTYITPEFLLNKLLFLKFKLLLALSIIPGLLFFVFASNELYNSQC